MSSWKVSYGYKKLFKMQFRELKDICKNNGVRDNWIAVANKLKKCSGLKKRLISTHALIDNMKPDGYLDASRLGGQLVYTISQGH